MFLRRLYFGVIALISLSLLSCIYIPYFAPEVNVAPAVVPRCSDNNCYAFRIDITKDTNTPFSFFGSGTGTDEYYALHPISVIAGKIVLPQVKLSLLHGHLYYGIFRGSAPEFVRHSVAIRLYRPRFQTVEIKAWEISNKVAWKSAVGLDAEEKALEDLLGVRGSGWIYSDEQPLAHGTASAGHKAALFFAASEYERLAKRITDQSDQGRREGLLKKAQKLKELIETGKKSRKGETFSIPILETLVVPLVLLNLLLFAR